MTLPRTIKALLSGAVALAGVVGVVAPSQAAVYRATWDPEYGRPFADLGWRGEVEFSTPDGCIITGALGWVTNLSIPEGCEGEIAVKATQVEFYDTTDSGAPTETLDNFQGAQIGLLFDSVGTPVGIRSTLFTPQQVDSDFPLTRFGSGQAYFSLIFLEDVAQLFWFSDEVGDLLLWALSSPPPAPAIAGLGVDIGCRRVSRGWIPCGWATPDPNRPSGAGAGAFLTFEAVGTVPEPTTLALVPIALAAMGLAGLSARRRRALAKP